MNDLPKRIVLVIGEHLHLCKHVPSYDGRVVSDKASHQVKRVKIHVEFVLALDTGLK